MLRFPHLFQWPQHRNHVPPERERFGLRGERPNGGRTVSEVNRRDRAEWDLTLLCVLKIKAFTLTDNLRILRKEGGKEIMLSGLSSDLHVAGRHICAF